MALMRKILPIFTPSTNFSKMKNFIFISLATSLAFLIACSPNKKQSEELPRVAICGLAIESSTFSPAQTTEEAFRVRRGEEVFSYYPFLRQIRLTAAGQSGFLPCADMPSPAEL
jgi:hypothetical protein